MKKLSLYLVLALLSYSIAQTQSSFPDCQGSDYTKWKNCYGKATFPGGDIYVGEFYNGNEHGQGTLTFLNGSIHAGQFKDGKFYGYGTHISADGR